MDDVLYFADKHILTPYVYPSSWSEDSLSRQALSLYAISLVGGYALYLIFAGLSYEFLFEKALMRHPKFLQNQVSREIWCACTSIPTMVALQVPFFLAEVRGHTKLYGDFSEHSIKYNVLALLCFLMFNDFLIYWIHRGLHHPLVYKHLHKTHHLWLVPTPFASHAFHPLDGFLQGLPYGLFIFVMPLHKWVHLVAFILVNYWTISIHIGPPYSSHMPDALKWIVNGPAHHTEHHLWFNYNYGQYTTIWDRIGGSFKHPETYDGKGPDADVVKLKKI